MGAADRSRLVRCLRSGLLAAALLAPVAAPAATTVLYDGASGLFPNSPSQPPATFWSLCSIAGSIPQCNPAFLPSGITQTMSGGAVILDTSSDPSIYAGYLRLSPVALNSTPPGIRLSFRVRLDDELHVNANRAGFSVIALDTQHRGVELGFWEDRIWAQSIDAGPPATYFVHGEEIAFDTTAGFADYDLTLSGTGYTLKARRGSSEATLTGPLRDYSPGKFYPYAVGNFLFFGDDTASASARVAIASISVTPVPEPETYALMLAGLGLVAAAIRRRRRTSPAA